MDRKESASKNSAKPGRQRALVLQGGGALGAFEVGVLKTLYKKLSEEDKKMEKIDCCLISLQVHQ